jgi:hypothetical protein
MAINDIRLTKQVYLKWDPQVYYLNMDGSDGFYVAQLLTLAHKKIPLSLSFMMNKVITTDLSTKDFDWNISLVYSFSNQLVKK